MGEIGGEEENWMDPKTMVLVGSRPALQHRSTSVLPIHLTNSHCPERLPPLPAPPKAYEVALLIVASEMLSAYPEAENALGRQAGLCRGEGGGRGGGMMLSVSILRQRMHWAGRQAESALT